MGATVLGISNQPDKITLLYSKNKKYYVFHEIKKTEIFFVSISISQVLNENTDPQEFPLCKKKWNSPVYCLLKMGLSKGNLQIFIPSYINENIIERVVDFFFNSKNKI